MYIIEHINKINTDNTNNNIMITDTKINKNIKQRTNNNIENNYYIPIYNDYKSFRNSNYKHTHLKKICKSYKLQLSGNKSVLNDRIYDHLVYTNFSIILQKYFRRYFVQIYFKLMGPALYNRSLCMNTTDFFSLENISDVKYNNFFSYKAKDNSIWGFSIISIYNLFIKSNKETINPYNRDIINQTYFKDIKQLINYSNLLKNPINIILNDNIESFSQKKKIELKCLELFQYMDELGHYTNINWFTNLNKISLIQFIRELYDIWEYRLQLTITTKQEICYPDGNPFRDINLYNLQNYNFILLQKTILYIIEQFIKKGINNESCYLGASYILCGFTLVNDNAAISMPWLYQSVATI